MKSREQSAPKLVNIYLKIPQRTVIKIIFIFSFHVMMNVLDKGILKINMLYIMDSIV